MNKYLNKFLEICLALVVTALMYAGFVIPAIIGILFGMWLIVDETFVHPPTPLRDQELSCRIIDGEMRVNFAENYVLHPDAPRLDKGDVWVYGVDDRGTTKEDCWDDGVGYVALNGAPIIGSPAIFPRGPMFVEENLFDPNTGASRTYHARFRGEDCAGVHHPGTWYGFYKKDFTDVQLRIKAPSKAVSCHATLRF